MPRPKSAVPAYRRHKATGKAVVTLSVGGKRRDYYLGEFNSAASRVEYQRLIAGYDATAPASSSHHEQIIHPRPGQPADATVAELVVLYLDFARRHYRDATGEPTTELNNVTVALRPVRQRYAHILGRELSPLKLKQVREDMIAQDWCRTFVNANVNRIRRFVKWCVSEELLPAAVLEALRSVSGLQPGRSAAREQPPVRPVEDAVVDATLPFLGRVVAGLVTFQRLTGCRPAEACWLRWCDLDMTGPVWHYRPTTHKGTWRGKERVIFVGPKAQALLAGFPTGDPGAFVFSPAAAVAERQAARSAARSTPRYPSHMRRNKAKRVKAPSRPPAERFTTASYGKALRYGVRKANKARVAAAVPPLPDWAPNQLRHTKGTQVRKQFGLHEAQVLLGHAKADVTQTYAQADHALGDSVAAAVG